LLAPNSELKFWHWIDAETETDTTAWDGAIIMLSVDNGDWIQISPIDSYPYTIVPNPASPFDPGTPCFSGSSDWDSVLFDLTGYEGVAQLMFRFGSDGAVTEEGWFIDDVVIGGGYACGDCNGDTRISIADATYIVNYIYRGGPAPIGQGDVNVDTRITVADATYLVNYIYRGGPEPCQPSVFLNDNKIKR